MPGFGNFKSKSNKKVRRKFLINNQKFSFFSKILNQNIVILCSTSLYRSIIINGGIDRYLSLKKVDPLFNSIKRKILNKQNKIYKKQIDQKDEQ